MLRISKPKFIKSTSFSSVNTLKQNKVIYVSTNHKKLNKVKVDSLNVGLKCIEKCKVYSGGESCLILELLGRHSVLGLY